MIEDGRSVGEGRVRGFIPKRPWLSRVLFVPVCTLGLFVVSLAPLVAFAATADAAAACPHGGNPNSTGCYTTSGLEGAEGQWHNNNLYMSSADYSQGYHINDEMWLYTNSNLSQWVETGLRNGYDPTDPCQCTAYEAFWADFNNQGYEFRHTILNTTPNGTNHVYEVLNQGGGSTHWNVYYDYNLVGTSTNQISSQAYVHQSGIEVGGPVDPSDHADTFNNYLQVYNGGWKNWSSEGTWIDYPCGANPQGYCLNGSSSILSEWSANKP